MTQSASSQKKPRERRENFALRLSPSEKTALIEKATDAELTLSEYLRSTGLKKHLRPPVPQINRETYVELGRIGNNINQMTKACHTAINQGRGCNINPAALSSLKKQLDLLRLQVIGIDPTDMEE